MHGEQRVQDRSRCELRAALVFGETLPDLPCLIENISASGARLRVEADLALPESFKIRVPNENDATQLRTVELRWRVGTAVGIRFVDQRSA